MTTCGNTGGCGAVGYQGVVARQWYHPYGSVRAGTGALPTDITFSGQRSDATGLYFYNARYYSPLSGRFISADTIVPEPGNPQALNRYAYVFNNPLKYTDPSGHDPCGGPGVHVPDCGVDGWGVKPPKSLTPTPPSSPTSSSFHPLPPSSLPNLGEAMVETAVLLDTISLVISGIGVLVTWGSTLGGAAFGAATCSPSGPSLAACILAGAIEGKTASEAAWLASPAGQAENVLGFTSAALTLVGETFTGASGMDPVTGELVISENTLRSVQTAIFGMIPSSNIDLAVNIVQVRWDVYGRPGQLRIDFSPLQFRWQSP